MLQIYRWPTSWLGCILVLQAQAPEPSHRERPGDRPAEGLTIPILTPSGTILHNGYLSVQVNVDSSGNNILGDAANEPSMAIDPTNPLKFVIGWRQFNHVSSDFRQAGWGYSHDGGNSWTFPGTLEPGVWRSDPVVDSDANGNFFYYSLRSGFYCDMFRSTNSGLSWDSAVPAYGGDKAWFTIDRTQGIGRGNIYAVWSPSFGPYGSRIFTRSTDGGQTFSPPVVPVSGLPEHGTLTIGPGGELYICGYGSSSSRSARFFKSSNAQDPSQTSVFEPAQSVPIGGSEAGGLPNPGGILGQMWIACDHSGGPSRGNVYMLATVRNSDPADVMFVRSTDGGLTWSSPARVNDDPQGNDAYQWFGAMSVAPNGRIDATWNDTRNTGAVNLSETYYSYSLDAGQTWSKNIPIGPVWNSHLGWPNQHKIGDYTQMISDDRGANLAYAATYNGEQDVYFARLGLDCNANGISDEFEIASGASVDVNSNGIPDGCDVDLTLAMTVSPAEVRVGQNLRYTIGVENLGAGISSSAFLADVLPNSLQFVSASSSKGSCTGGKVIICDLGPLLPGEKVKVEIVARAPSAGSISNSATVSLYQPSPTGEVTVNPIETDTGNNTATASATVTGERGKRKGD